MNHIIVKIVTITVIYSAKNLQLLFFLHVKFPRFIRNNLSERRNDAGDDAHIKPFHSYPLPSQSSSERIGIYCRLLLIIMGAIGANVFVVFAVVLLNISVISAEKYQFGDTIIIDAQSKCNTGCSFPFNLAIINSLMELTIQSRHPLAARNVKIFSCTHPSSSTLSKGQNV